MANAQAIMNDLKMALQTHGRDSQVYKQKLDQAIRAFGGQEGSAGPGGADAAQQMAQQLDAGTTPTGTGIGGDSLSFNPQPGQKMPMPGFGADSARGSVPQGPSMVRGQLPPQPIQGGQEVGPPMGANTPQPYIQPPTPGTKPAAPSPQQPQGQPQGQGQMMALMQQLQGQGEGQGQPQEDDRFMPGGVPWRQMLMGLAAGQAGLGRSPAVHQVLSNAAAGMYQTQQNYAQQQAAQRQQQVENQLAYMEAMAGGDRSQFERLLDQAGFDPQQKQEIIRQWVQRQAQGSGGTRVSLDENGNPVVQIGGPYSSEMRPSTQGNIEQKQTDLEGLQSRLQGIEEIYKPERLTYQDKAYFQLLRQKNKAGIELSPEEREYLVETTQMKRRAYENLNLYIQEITGAQMSQEEAKRLRRVMPDPGDGIFDGDSPLQFEANLNDALSRVRASLKRYKDLRERGLLPRSGQVTEELTKEHPLQKYQDLTDDLSGMSRDELVSEGRKLYNKAQEQGLTPDEYERYQRIQKLAEEKRNGG